jgi:hypothetical protein
MLGVDMMFSSVLPRIYLRREIPVTTLKRNYSDR